jgi:hypothetical protein
MHVEMIACYFATKMPCWRNVVFVKHHDTSEMIKISMKMTWEGGIKKLKECQVRCMVFPHNPSFTTIVLEQSKCRVVAVARERAQKRCNTSSSC